MFGNALGSRSNNPLISAAFSARVERQCSANAEFILEQIFPRSIATRK